MNVRSTAIVALLSVFALSQKLNAAELFEINRSARALGMGNAYTSVVTNEDSLFYNPAGIARNTGFYVTLADPAIGLNGLDSLDSYSNITADSAGFSTALNTLYDQPIWIGANAKAAIHTPFFAAAYYYNVDGSILAYNPAATNLDVNIIYDTGIAIGSGFSAGIFQFGAVAKRIQRTGARRTFGPAAIAEVVSGGDPGLLFDQFDPTGIGYALDMGFNFGFPLPVSPNLSFVWKNIGNTKFSPDSPSLEAPPTEDQEMVLGASLIADLPLVSISPSIDIKHLMNSDVQLAKKIHMGVELDLPIIDLRVGLHQGYLSYGAGLSLGLFEIDFASWGVELGEYPGQFEDRRYMVQFAVRIGFDVGLGGFGSSSSGGKGSSAKNSSSAVSKVKRRR